MNRLFEIKQKNSPSFTDYAGDACYYSFPKAINIYWMHTLEQVYSKRDSLLNFIILVVIAVVSKVTLASYRSCLLASSFIQQTLDWMPKKTVDIPQVAEMKRVKMRQIICPQFMSIQLVR